MNFCIPGTETLNRTKQTKPLFMLNLVFNGSQEDRRLMYRHTREGVDIHVPVCMCAIMNDKENQRTRQDRAREFMVTLFRDLPEKRGVNRDLNEIQE